MCELCPSPRWFQATRKETFPGYPQDEEKPVDNGRPRIVEVYMDICGDLDVLVVDVMGVEKHQKLENFIWHSGKLPPPEES